LAQTEEVDIITTFPQTQDNMTKSQNSADGGDVAVDEQQDMPAIVSTETMLLLKELDGKPQKDDGMGAITDRGTLKEV
jgi:hypothetical protein